ncbi:Long chain acyl-CoA synthetase 7, peroxisomal [Smittium mucronatum]|uniref:Long chain acyl-CoA synthetase 7, peroxisomal n=1 Tax=Smittium mucronatum TaxID=133383 RepID=A0A1R0GQK7_9FUNG|nr:Long chain acyl-CoA synthetase 7, peroxisomal [Smittium mucronatum]
MKSYAVPNSEGSGLSRHRPINAETGQFEAYVFETYKEVAERATRLGSGIIELRKMTNKKGGDLMERNWPVAIYSINRPEWTICDKALNTQSLYSVALYDTLGASSMSYILNHCEAPIVVCSIDKVAKILTSIDELTHLEAIISLDSLVDSKTRRVRAPFNEESCRILVNWAKSKNIVLVDIFDTEEMGLMNPKKHNPPRPSDIYTIMYTSGTTGNPKGAVTTHGNYAYAAHISAKYSKDQSKSNIPSIVSFLPLAHAYGRTRENTITLQGGFIGYYCGDVTKILEDTRALQPTSFTGVPRLLTRFYDLISSKTIHSSNLVIKTVSQMGANAKIRNLKESGTLDHSVYDPLIFNRTKALLSSNLENISTGTAPVEPYVTDFLRISLKTLITEGYAMTETASVGTRQMDDDLSNGTVGVPGKSVELRLRSVPDMDYLVSDNPSPRGELLIRSPTVFIGYLKNKQATDETLIGDGWLASGDIAKFNVDGSVSIIDRKKSLFKLSQGEYISPEKIEVVITQDPLIMQAFVAGKQYKNHLVAILVPDPLTFTPWASKLLPGAKSIQELCQSELVNRRILERLIENSKKSKLLGFETVKAIYLDHRPFDVDNNGLLTPTFKLKRFDAAKYYKKTIDALYESPPISK